LFRLPHDQQQKDIYKLKHKDLQKEVSYHERNQLQFGNSNNNIEKGLRNNGFTAQDYFDKINHFFDDLLNDFPERMQQDEEERGIYVTRKLFPTNSILNDPFLDAVSLPNIFQVVFTEYHNKDIYYNNLFHYCYICFNQMKIQYQSSHSRYEPIFIAKCHYNDTGLANGSARSDVSSDRTTQDGHVQRRGQTSEEAIVIEYNMAVVDDILMKYIQKKELPDIMEYFKDMEKVTIDDCHIRLITIQKQLMELMILFCLWSEVLNVTPFFLGISSSDLYEYMKLQKPLKMIKYCNFAIKEFSFIQFRQRFHDFGNDFFDRHEYIGMISDIPSYRITLKADTCNHKQK
jgi:hypothetical protein